MGAKRRTAILLIASATLLTVNCYPRKRLTANDNRRSIKVDPDYWTQRGFHEALTDHFLESESRVRDLMLAGDEIEDFRGTAQIRIPRERLTPPELPKEQQARRKQDMEIMESITLLDGGTQLDDGSIKIRESGARSQRKYHDERLHDQVSPLSYHLPDDYELKYKQNQESRRTPSFPSSNYHTLPFYASEGKSPIGSYKPPHPKPKPARPTPAAIQPVSISQFQQLLQPQPQPQIPYQSLYSPPPTTTSAPVAVPTPKRQVIPIYVISPPSPQYLHQIVQPPRQHPSPLQQHIQQQLQQQQQQPQPPHPSFNSQIFQQQFPHPFAPPPPEANPIAQLTASLISTASGAAAAAGSLAKGELLRANLPPAVLPQLPLPSPPVSIPAASQNSPQILVPTSAPSPPPTTPRLGVVPDDENVVQDQLIQPENLAARLTRMYETGRKILYFPKGVMDTVDTLLKQVERNPMVAYWGDKFFAKVFGDTSGT